MTPERAVRMMRVLSKKAPAMFRQAVDAAAVAMRARPVYLRNQPFEKRAEAVRRALARVAPNPVADELLAIYFLECRKELLIEWLDLIGVAARGGHAHGGRARRAARGEAARRRSKKYLGDGRRPRPRAAAARLRGAALDRVARARRAARGAAGLGLAWTPAARPARSAPASSRATRRIGSPPASTRSRFCDEILVVDSHSRDRTRELAAARGARVIERDWPGHVAQKEFAVRAGAHDWVLCVDADERVSPELRAEIEALRDARLRGRRRLRGAAPARATSAAGSATAPGIPTGSCASSTAAAGAGAAAIRTTASSSRDRRGGCAASCSTTRTAASTSTCARSTATRR